MKIMKACENTTNIDIHLYIYCVNTFILINMHAYICTYISTYISTYIHTYIRIYIHKIRLGKSKKPLNFQKFVS